MLYNIPLEYDTHIRLRSAESQIYGANELLDSVLNRFPFTLRMCFISEVPLGWVFGSSCRMAVIFDWVFLFGFVYLFRFEEIERARSDSGSGGQRRCVRVRTQSCNNASRQFRQSPVATIRTTSTRLHSHEMDVEEALLVTTEMRLSATSSGGVATSTVCLSPVIMQNRLKTCKMSGLFVLSSIQHSLMSSHTASVIPISSAFSGFRGRLPETTARTTSASLFG